MKTLWKLVLMPGIWVYSFGLNRFCRKVTYRVQTASFDKITIDFCRYPSHSYWIIANHCGSRCRQDWNKSIKMDSKQLKMVQNWSEELLKSRLWGSWGGGEGGDPPKSVIFIGSWPPWRLDFGVPFGTLFGSWCHPGSPWTENWRFWGGLVAEYFFEEILSPFWRVSG